MELHEKDFLLEKARQAADSLGAFMDQESIDGLIKLDQGQKRKTIVKSTEEDLIQLVSKRKGRLG